MSQLQLLASRRFWPFFWTQFLGAFNDNVFRNALIILIAYRAVTIGGLATEQVVALAAGLFILPFFLFSATAGQLADKIAKSRLMRWVKAVEIGVMSIAAFGFLTENIGLLLLVLFFMGLQSTFFGPAKYSVLPEMVKPDELVGANAVVEMGTFVAILLGTIAGGLLIAFGESGPFLLSASVLGAATLGWLSSMAILKTPAGEPDLKIQWNPVTPTVATYRVTRKNRPVFLSILGISWFWFLGSSFLTLLPTYTKGVLFGDERSVTFFLSLFCVGIATGSLLCERLSGKKLELGLTPLGSIGMTVFAFDLFLAGEPYASGGQPLALLPLGELLSAPGTIRVAIDMGLIAVFSGFFTVPLYTMVQERSDARIRSRVIAGNNILNALFMVASALMLMGAAAIELTPPQIFLILALLNAAVALYIYQVIPEFLLRFVAWMVASVMYRMRVRGIENIPKDGPGLLVCNHVSYVDWLLIASPVKRPVRFVMHHSFYRLPLIGWAFRDAKVIPIAGKKEDETTREQAFERIGTELDQGQLVCIFPEGKLTRTGQLNPFKRGVEHIIARHPVPVIPMALEGMWGSFFSHRGGALRGAFRRVWSRVSLVVGQPLEPRTIKAERLAERVAALGGFVPPVPPSAAGNRALGDCG